MGPFTMYHGYQYILVAVVSKWIEIVACRTNDNKVVNFLKENVFSRAIRNDGEKYFYNCTFEALMRNSVSIIEYSPLTTHRLVVK